MSVIGKAAPNFKGQAAHKGEIVKVDLNDYKGKWVVLFFYPLDFTFVCPTEIVAFDAAHGEFQKSNTEVIGCSVDSVHTHLAYMRTPRSEGGIGDIKYPLLADLDKSVAAAYDVLNGDVALRGVFVIDPDGVIQAATVNNLSVGRNINEVLRTLHAFQRVREEGDTCPANWMEGDAGMDRSLQAVAGVISG